MKDRCCARSLATLTRILAVAAAATQELSGRRAARCVIRPRLGRSPFIEALRSGIIILIMAPVAICIGFAIAAYRKRNLCADDDYSEVGGAMGIASEQKFMGRASDLQERVTNSQSAMKHSGQAASRKAVTATATGLAGVLTFFAALMSACVVRKGSPAADWQFLQLPPVFWLDTVILLGSAGALFYARQRLQRVIRGIPSLVGGDRDIGMLLCRGSAIGLAPALPRRGINLGANPSSSFLYLFTAAHAALALGGVVALLSAAFLSKQHLPSRSTTAAVTLYWHCTFALWIGIFLSFLFLR